MFSNLLVCFVAEWQREEACPIFSPPCYIIKWVEFWPNPGIFPARNPLEEGHLRVRCKGSGDGWQWARDGSVMSRRWDPSRNLWGLLGKGEGLPLPGLVHLCQS